MSTPITSFATFSTASTANIFFGKFSALFTGPTGYMGMLDVSFGGLFILFLGLKIVEASALTIVAPIAIVMRSLSFMGPQLRRMSNLFLAMAIGFYFVLPLMIVLNSYVASCLNIGASIPQATCNYPFFSAYMQGYNLPATSTSLFTSSTQYPVNSQVLPSFASGG